MTAPYDIAIIGLGAAGINLLLELNKPEFRHLAILILDENPKTQNDRTWCFWEKGQSEIDEIVHYSWGFGRFENNATIKLNLSPYKYKMVRSIDFYNQAKQIIEQNKNIHFVQGKVVLTKEEEDFVTIQTKEEGFLANHVFDSRLSPDFFEQKEKYNGVSQHFVGHFIETKEAVFTPDAFTMMDYRLKDEGTTSFMYVLPFTTNRALLEFTYFSNKEVDKETYIRFIQEYVKTFLRDTSYEILETEQGQIPMNMFPFHNKHSRRITKIGTAGGAVKPSSGYSFQFARKQAKHYANGIRDKSIKPYPVSKRFRFYDQVFLGVLQNNNHLGREIFTKLYQNNSPQRIFRFLDEESSWLDELKIISSFGKYSGLFLKEVF